MDRTIQERSLECSTMEHRCKNLTKEVEKVGKGKELLEKKLRAAHHKPKCNNSSPRIVTLLKRIVTLFDLCRFQYKYVHH